MSAEDPRAHLISGAGSIDSEESFGTSGVNERAREEWLVEGYVRALARFRSVPQDREDPDLPRKLFIPLFEALSFAGSLIERLEPRKKPRQEAHSALQGLRYTRNRVLHQWAFALQGSDVAQPGSIRATGGSRIIAPPVVFDWFWKPLAELSGPGKGRPPDDLGRESYAKYLDGQPARVALEEMERMLRARGGEL